MIAAQTNSMTILTMNVVHVSQEDMESHGVVKIVPMLNLLHHMAVQVVHLALAQEIMGGVGYIVMSNRGIRLRIQTVDAIHAMMEK